MPADRPDERLAPERLAGLDLLPLPGFPAPLAAELARRLSRRLALPVAVLGADVLGDGGQPAPVAVVPGRRQADADALLALLEAQPRRPERWLVGATLQDIGNPVFTFFFGRARQHGHAALVSLARLGPEWEGLPPDPELTLERAAREVLHELGHLGGLPHCTNHTCLMHFAPTVEAIDQRSGDFCATCASSLPPGLAG